MAFSHICGWINIIKTSKTYRLYNLYIDTSDHALIRHSMTRPEYKEKIRIRSYDKFSDDTQVFLEIKKRYKQTTNKRRTKIPYSEALEFIATGALPHQHQYMNMQVAYELEAMLSARQYSPKTLIRYDRLAFHARSEESDLRLTFDADLVTCRYGGDDEQTLLGDDRMIMELKSSYNIPLWLVELLSEAGVQRQGFSKYGQEYLHYLRTTSTTLAGGIYA